MLSVTTTKTNPSNFMFVRVKHGLWWAVSLALVAGGGLYIFHSHAVASALQSRALEEYKPAAVKPQERLNDISHLSLNRLGISLKVKEGKYDPASHSWTLDDSHAFFVKDSVTPLAYGHAIASVFAPLSDVREGDVLHVRSGEKLFTLHYKGSVFIRPDDMTLLSKDFPNTLMLMTCSGVYSEERRVLYFEQSELVG